MLLPKRTKYRKQHRRRGCLAGLASTGTRIAFGAFGLKATSRGELTSRQLEAARRAISRAMKRGGKTWIRVFPHKAVTQKAAEVPMGSGKGSVEHYVVPVKPGVVIFELDGVGEEMAREALRLASHKLGLKTRFVIRNAI